MFRQALFLSGIVSSTLRPPASMQLRGLAVSMDLVRQLRERSGAPIMDCKKALEVPDVAGDMNKAVEWLRKKGIASADAKAHRTAAEGIVAVSARGNRCAVLELNCETDFVARNTEFQEFARAVTAQTLDSNPGLSIDVANLLARPFGNSDITVKDSLAELISKIRENIVISRAAVLEVPSGVIGSYVHNSVGPDVGKSAAIVALNCDKQTEAIADAAKKLAMHITAARPAFLDESRVPADVLEKERQIYREQAASSGKPANIVEKMTEGRMKKFLAENTLVGQPHMIEPNNPVVSQFLKQLGEKEGTSIEVTEFVRYTVGERQASN